MIDFFLKLLILKIEVIHAVAGAFHYWHKDVWPKALDNRICCDGNMCGCYGITLREQYFRRRQQQ